MKNVVTNSWSYLWFIIPAILGILCRNKIPAGILIVPLVVTAIMNISPIKLSNVPAIIFIAGQIALGVGLGQSISISSLRLVGKYCAVYFGLTVLLIAISFGLGALLALFTRLNIETAILCLVPGGFIEMVLTAGVVGADPSIVSALQLTRLLVILIIVLPLLKWYFKKSKGYTTLNS
jgi:membrane AbrB-like protein